MDMYRRLGVFDYALSVFLTMEDRDVVSWNCLILSCSDSGNKEVALDQFWLMREMEIQPDEYTVSMVVSICSDLRELSKDWMIRLNFLESWRNGIQCCAIP
jgi:hypothetical protein